MHRRQVLKGGIIAAGGVSVLAAPAIAQSAPEVKWRLTSSFPKSLDTIFGTAQTFSKYVSEMTDNAFQIQVFAAGEIVPGQQALDAVTSGSVECAQTPTYFYFGKEPTLAFGTGIPFGLNQRHQESWWSFGGGGEIVNEALKKFNAFAIPMGNSGTQMGGWFRKEINTVEDLKGLKFRIGGMGGHVLQRLGVVAQQITPGDIYPALERGTIDAAEFVGPYDDEKLGLAKIAKYYYYPGWWEGSAMMHLIVNNDQWAKLPKNYQHIVARAADAANNWMMAKYDAVNAPALRRLVAAGATPKGFPMPVLEACYKAANDYYGELGAQNPLFKKAYDSMTAYRNEQMPWWQIAEYNFDTMMIVLRSKG
ncbi:MAG TPA: TRAP transporter substrate-binding protein DctP [Hyphomicrobiaceae bacterium]|nr:TRAP transporter substrate-binding protein DctP [Hyphomicrobiaceae bacterium]